MEGTEKCIFLFLRRKGDLKSDFYMCCFCVSFFCFVLFFNHEDSLPGNTGDLILMTSFPLNSLMFCLLCLKYFTIVLVKPPRRTCNWMAAVSKPHGSGDGSNSWLCPETLELIGRGGGSNSSWLCPEILELPGRSKRAGCLKGPFCFPRCIGGMVGSD